MEYQSDHISYDTCIFAYRLFMTFLVKDGLMAFIPSTYVTFEKEECGYGVTNNGAFA